MAEDETPNALLTANYQLVKRERDEARSAVEMLQQSYVRFRQALRDALFAFWPNNPGVDDEEIVDAVRRVVAERADLKAISEIIDKRTYGVPTEPGKTWVVKTATPMYRGLTLVAVEPAPGHMGGDERAVSLFRELLLELRVRHIDFELEIR